MIHPTARIGGVIDGVNPHLITIGQRTVVGTHAAVLSHCPVRGALSTVIGNHCWLGYGAIVLPGVTVGDCCLIGAGAVVSRDVPDGCIVAGNPARILRLLTEDERRELTRRLENQEPMGKDDVRGDSNHP